jgi:hypothetical protein
VPAHKGHPHCPPAQQPTAHTPRPPTTLYTVHVYCYQRSLPLRPILLYVLERTGALLPPLQHASSRQETPNEGQNAAGGRGGRGRAASPVSGSGMCGMPWHMALNNNVCRRRDHTTYCTPHSLRIISTPILRHKSTAAAVRHPAFCIYLYVTHIALQ